MHSLSVPFGWPVSTGVKGIFNLSLGGISEMSSLDSKDPPQSEEVARICHIGSDKVSVGE